MNASRPIYIRCIAFVMVLSVGLPFHEAQGTQTNGRMMKPFGVPPKAEKSHPNARKWAKRTVKGALAVAALVAAIAAIKDPEGTKEATEKVGHGIGVGVRATGVGIGAAGAGLGNGVANGVSGN